MKVERLGRGYYQVTDGSKWWTLILLTSGHWYITNHLGREVKQDGTLGRRLFSAIRVEGA